MNAINDPATAQAAQWLAQLDRALANSDLAGAVALLATNATGAT